MQTQCTTSQMEHVANTVVCSQKPTQPPTLRGKGVAAELV